MAARALNRSDKRALAKLRGRVEDAYERSQTALLNVGNLEAPPTEFCVVAGLAVSLSIVAIPPKGFCRHVEIRIIPAVLGVAEPTRWPHPMVTRDVAEWLGLRYASSVVTARPNGLVQVDQIEDGVKDLARAPG